MNTMYNFDDIALVPEFSSVSSRADVDTSFALTDGSPFTFRVPVCPSNMRCSISEDLCKTLSESEYFYIMHRFDNNNYSFVKTANEELWRFISISIGVSEADFNVLEDIVRDGYRVDCVTVDIAHGHCHAMMELLPRLNELLPRATIIAGNVATPIAVSDLYHWGADVVKVGIGGGSVCSTKLKTGFTSPMFSCLEACAIQNHGVPIIADGGVKHNGDIAKALVAGARFAMAGNMFVACKDSPTRTIYPGPATKLLSGYTKIYFGSASKENKGNSKHIEGFQTTVVGNHLSYKEKLTEIQEDLSSAVSYAGGKDLSCFPNVAYNVVK
jgi:GMP reductase